MISSKLNILKLNFVICRYAVLLVIWPQFNQVHIHVSNIFN